MSGLRIFLQGLREVKPKQSCIIGCQILLTPTSYNIMQINILFLKGIKNVT
ncbi:hypothetical protein GCWU000282_00554 [Catonella morbi ATCC 51271]|uniref:Uncharacterized protein n=1 Tax=Catonella morbi ATCC 51271 TaxID=592026 RepID=V2Y961_9FIRM|nr:hypothetical protein GCWU000282_00554 [Catonella morbi ATCC 51271]